MNTDTNTAPALREAFEHHWYDTYHSGYISAREDGRYWPPEVQKSWEAWQACAALSTAAAPKEAKAEPVQPERLPLTESQIVKCLADADCGGIVKTFYYSSRHERNRPSISVTRLVDAIERAHGIQPAHKEQP